MCSELKLVDTVELKYKLTTKFPCETSEDNFTSITTDKGTLICRLHTPKNNSLFNVTYSKQFIEASKFILSKHLDIDVDALVPWMKQFDLYECILRTDTSASLDNCAKIRFSSVCARWSPQNIVGTHNIIAILNDTGSLEVYFRLIQYTGITKYVQIHNVTQKGIEQYKNEWKNIDALDTTAKVDELKRRLDIHTPTAFVWTHLINNLEYPFALLVVAYANGRIAFWKYESIPEIEYKDLDTVFVHDHLTNLSNISCMHWIQSEHGGLLIIGTESGKVTSLPITNIQADSVNICEEMVFYGEVDVKVEYIRSSLYDNKLYIYIIKQSYILIYLLSDEGIILDQCNFCAGNLNITGFHDYGDNMILILMHTGVCKELKIRCIEQKINIEWKHIYVNINWTLKRVAGVFASKNNLIVSFLTEACRAIDMKEERENVHFTTFINKHKDPLVMLLSNKTNSLYNYSDCLEAIRITGYQNKELICNKLSSNTNYDNMSLIQLKTYLHLAKISEQIYDQLESVCGYNLRPSNEIQLMVEIKLAVYYIQLILAEYGSTRNLSSFMKTSLKELVTFLKEVVLQDLPLKFKFGPNIIDEIFDVMLRTKNFELPLLPPCHICGNDLYGTSCLNRHFDNRCVITMTQITQPKYKCPVCMRCVCEKAIKHFKVFCCPICDFPLDVILGQKTNLKDYADNRCHPDCLKEDVM